MYCFLELCTSVYHGMYHIAMWNPVVSKPSSLKNVYAQGLLQLSFTYGLNCILSSRPPGNAVHAFGDLTVEWQERALQLQFGGICAIKYTNTGHLEAHRRCILEPRLPKGDILELSFRVSVKVCSNKLALTKVLL